MENTEIDNNSILIFGIKLMVDLSSRLTKCFNRSSGAQGQQELQRA
jgi:hypothetical protein